jgi:aspartate aminotransferase
MLVTSGGSEALIIVSALIADPGDEFIVFEPFYTNYNSLAIWSAPKLFLSRFDAQKGFHLPTDAEIESKITSRTKQFFFTNPNNPTGTVFTMKRCEELSHWQKT